MVGYIPFICIMILSSSPIHCHCFRWSRSHGHWFGCKSAGMVSDDLEANATSQPDLLEFNTINSCWRYYKQCRKHDHIGTLLEIFCCGISDHIIVLKNISSRGRGICLPFNRQILTYLKLPKYKMFLSIQVYIFMPVQFWKRLLPLTNNSII
jgi:hypothetical protein